MRDMSQPYERLKIARKAAGYDSAPEAAGAMGIPDQTYMGHENGSRGFRRTVERYAKFFRVSPEWLLFGTGQGPREERAVVEDTEATGQPVSVIELKTWIKTQAERNARSQRFAARPKHVLKRVPVVGEVAAGVWRESTMSVTDEVSEYVDVSVRGYERLDLWALEVVGPSMDVYYAPGRFVVVASPAEAGLRVGDHVVCERERNGLYEITLKELVMIDGRHALMPRSSHPDYQEPIFLPAAGDFDQTAPKIVGVVVADYGNRKRSPILFMPQQEDPQ